MIMYVPKHAFQIVVFFVKMTTPSRKLRHTAVASLTVFITERGGGTPYFKDL